MCSIPSVGGPFRWSFGLVLDVMVGSLFCFQVVSLLSVESFLQISCQLISETSGDIQRKSLDMLTAKIEKGEVKLTTEHVSL